MSFSFTKHYLETEHHRVQSFKFLPDNTPQDAPVFLFTHGYTAQKTDVVPWGQRLASAGFPVITFDLPGHYLGSFEEAHSFEAFKQEAPQLFYQAFNLAGFTQSKNIILAGHSLGALFAIKALKLSEFASFNRLAIGVGFGLNPSQDTHLFDTQFYKNTLKFRRQLVSECINPDIIFPWIKEEKENIEISGERIHLICGQDDVVVGKGGAESLKQRLEEHGNQVSLEMPKLLAHHKPEMAAAHIHAFLKKEQVI